MKIKTFIISAITLFISLYLIIGYHSLKHIDKNRIDVSKYITLVDEVSENKVQVNWKYVVSIIAVENKNKIKNIIAYFISIFFSLNLLIYSLKLKSSPFNMLDNLIKFERKRLHTNAPIPKIIIFCIF